MTRRAKPRARQGGADKVWAVGLAGATCLGLVGTVGVRTAQEAAAEPVRSEDQIALVSGAPPQARAVSSHGLTEGQLDQYAQALGNERLRLEAYHAELLDVAARLQEAANAQAVGKESAPFVSESVSKPIPAPKPVPKPVAAPQLVEPQAQTRGS
jgi:hypothetical protein